MVILVAGYSYLRGRHVQQVEVLQKSLASPPPTPVPEPQLKVYENEPTLRGSQAILSGTVRNISAIEIDNLTIELELVPRQGQEMEQRQLPMRPHKLSAGEEGKYQLSISSGDYRGARVAKLISKTSTGESLSRDVPFSVEPGARRPKERPPAAIGSSNARQNRNRSSEFLNTPDNPVGLP